MKTIGDIQAHFSRELSPEIKDFAMEMMFDRYIFTRRQGKQQYGYCTYCNTEFKSAGLKHGHSGVCPNCNSRCSIKAGGRGRKHMIDHAYFVYYEKSIIDPESITARGIYAVRDYSGDYKKVQTKYKDRARYVFTMGGSAMIKREYCYYSMAKTMEAGEFKVTTSVFSLFNIGSYSRTLTDYSRKSIRKAVKGTPFRFSTWESYDDKDMTKFFDLYSKYRCVEYLTKLGLEKLVTTKLEGGQTFGAVNWKGKDLFKVLRLTKQEFKEIKKYEIQIDFYFLKIFHISEKNSWGLSLPEVAEFAQSYDSYYFDELLKLLSYGSIKKITSYLEKQSHGTGKNVFSTSYTLTSYRDYIDDCNKLGLDLAHERVLFPKNLYQAHQRTTKQIKVQADEKTNQKIIARAQSLQQFCFEHQGLLIRPAASFKELIEEGKALEHCVGNYADRYADGSTSIFFIRRKSAPKKPFFTMELRERTITQVRGLKNCDPDKRVKELLKAFEMEKLQKQTKKRKLKQSA